MEKKVARVEDDLCLNMEVKTERSYSYSKEEEIWSKSQKTDEGITEDEADCVIIGDLCLREVGSH